MQNITIYSTQSCPYCIAAKNLLKGKHLDFEEFDVSRDPKKREEMFSLSPQRTVPQIVINGQHIGGYTDLVKHFKKING